MKSFSSLASGCLFIAVVGLTVAVPNTISRQLDQANLKIASTEMTPVPPQPSDETSADVLQSGIKSASGTIVKPTLGLNRQKRQGQYEYYVAQGAGTGTTGYYGARYPARYGGGIGGIGGGYNDISYGPTRYGGIGGRYNDNSYGYYGNRGGYYGGTSAGGYGWRR